MTQYIDFFIIGLIGLTALVWILFRMKKSIKGEGSCDGCSSAHNSGRELPTGSAPACNSGGCSGCSLSTACKKSK